MTDTCETWALPECNLTAMPFKDKRKGFLWHCGFINRLVGKGRKRPDCSCAKALRGEHRESGE